MCDVNFQWHLLLFTFYYCQCFSNFECQSINLFQVLNWYILTFDNKCAQKQFYCEICNMQNTNYFQYWQFCFICHSNWGFMSNNETFSYLFLQKYKKKNTQSFRFISLKIHPLFLMIYLSSAVALWSALYFLITVNLFNMSIIDLFPQLNEILIWPTKVLTELFVWKCWSALILSRVSTEHFLISTFLLERFEKSWALLIMDQ